MQGKNFFLFDLLPNFKNRDEYFRNITQGDGASRTVLNLVFFLLIFAFMYGIVMGSYHGVTQALASGIKLCCLFFLVIIICFPAFFIIQYILGSKLGLWQMAAVILSGFVLTTAIMISFSPIIVFFLLTGSNYYFLQLLHVFIMLFSGIFGMMTVVELLKHSCEVKNVYPQTGVIVFRFWVVILTFVGIQLAWNLRPFLGDRGQPFEMFRDYEGNFYTALIYSVRQLAEGDDNNGDEKPERNSGGAHGDSVLPFIRDLKAKR